MTTACQNTSVVYSTGKAAFVVLQTTSCNAALLGVQQLQAHLRLEHSAARWLPLPAAVITAAYPAFASPEHASRHLLLGGLLLTASENKAWQGSNTGDLISKGD
jgi:hypothetical protein